MLCMTKHKTEMRTKHSEIGAAGNKSRIDNMRLKIKWGNRQRNKTLWKTQILGTEIWIEKGG